MAIAQTGYADAAPGDGGAGTIIASIVSAAVGEAVLVHFRWAKIAPALTITSVTCPGETVSLLGSMYGPGPVFRGGYHQWAIIRSVAAAGTKTITLQLSGATESGSGAYTARRLTGHDATTQPDAVAGATGTTANPSLSLTTASANCAIFAAATLDGGECTAGTNFTLDAAVNSFNFDSAERWLDAGAAGAKTVDFGAAADNWSMTGIAIKAAGGAAATSLLLRRNPAARLAALMNF